MDFKKVDEEISAELTTEENAVLEKFMQLNTRIQILKYFRNSAENVYNPLTSLDKILESKDIPDKDAFVPINKTLSVAMSCLDVWIEELETELKGLQDQVIVFMLRISIKEYASDTKERFKTKVIEPSIPKYIVKYFLADKFGEDDSPAKDAMSDICTEAVNYFISSMTSGVFEKVMADMNS